MAERAHISLLTKLAACIVQLGLVDRDAAKAMTAKAIVGMVDFDHIVLHALTRDDHATNLRAMLRAEHREKSRGDTTILAKCKRVSTQYELHCAEMRRKMIGTPPKQERPRKRWGSRKLGGGAKLRLRGPKNETAERD